jgi:hypothetical protein
MMKTNRNKPTRQRPNAALRFSPYAWAKLMFMRDFRDCEMGAFGITRADDLLLIEDIVLVKQKVSWVTVSFDDGSVADFFDQQVDCGRKPEQFARVWLHTHPGDSPVPSTTDEETFSRVFGKCDWSVMFIIDQNDNTYARLCFGIGPGGQAEIPVGIDYSTAFSGTDFKAWKAEYILNVTPEKLIFENPKAATGEDPSDFGDTLLRSDEILHHVEQMDPLERQLLLDELASQSIVWDEEAGVFYD